MVARAGTMIAALAVAIVVFAQTAGAVDRSTRDFMSRLGLVTAGEGLGNPPPSPPSPPPSGLVDTRFVQGDFNGKYAPPLRFKKVIARTIKCPTDDCAVEAIMSVQYTVDSGLNDLGICFSVDKKTPWALCPVLGTMNPLARYEMTTTTAVVTGLSKGKHKVQVDFISNDGASLFAHEITFNVYAE